MKTARHRCYSFLYLGFFEFVHNVRRRGKALLGVLIELLSTDAKTNLYLSHGRLSIWR